MRLDFLGHASILLAGAERTVLFDPLLLGLHHEGLYDVYPRRTLDLGGLPALSAVVVSHAHLDHLDLPSLSLLPRELPVYTAADPLILACLQGLGFRSVRAVTSFSPFSVGGLEIMPTPGAPGTLEHGFVVRAGAAVAWNLVDTSPPAEAIAEVKRRYPVIDVAVVPWQPLLDTAVAGGGALAFPHEAYSTLVANALDVGARAIVPGASGFAAVGPQAWMNHVMFPVTRARFMLDLVTASPALAGQVFALDPGDRLTLEGGAARPEPGAVAYCHAEPHRWEDLAFRPHDAASAVAEHRGALFTVAENLPLVRAFFEDFLPGLAAREPAAFAAHRRLGVEHEFEVVFADGRRHFTLDFRGEAPTARAGRSPLALASTIISAGLLTGLVAGTVSWDFAAFSGEYRRHEHAYLVGPSGIGAARPSRLVDPLRLVFGGPAARERALAGQLERILAATAEST
jgi:L-ascorbate metabolism protein UlaG (beta-lactamase superfamily)